MLEEDESKRTLQMTRRQRGHGGLLGSTLGFLRELSGVDLALSVNIHTLLSGILKQRGASYHLKQGRDEGMDLMRYL